MKRNTGRPPVIPTGDKSTITMKITADLKRKILTQASAYDMTITEYITTLIERDSHA